MNELNDHVRCDDTGTFAETAGEDRTGSSSQPVLQPARVIVHCPHCKSTLRVRRAYIGGLVRCKQCDQDFLLAPPEGTQPPAFSGGSPGFEPASSHHVGSVSPSDSGAGAMGPLLDQVAKFVAAHEELRSAHQELLAQRSGAREELESTRTSLSRTSGELEAIRAALGTMASDLVSALRASTEPLGAEVRALLTSTEPLGAELTALRADNQNLVSAVSECQRSIARIEEKVDEAAQLSTQLEKARAALDSSERARGQEVEELKARLASLGDEHAELLEKYQSSELLLANVQARNAELTAKQEQLAGMYQASLECDRLELEKLAADVAGLRAGFEGLDAAGP
jgi:predicted Zn finger-like uncharacterized protein